MNLNKMTKKELLALAKTHDIKRRTLMDKEELTRAINAVMKKSGVKTLRKKAPEKGYEAAAAPKPQAKSKAKAVIPDYYEAPYYDQDTLFFLPVDPGSEYAYWEVSAGTQERLKKELGVKKCSFELRVHCNDGGDIRQLAHQPVDSRGDWYFGLWAPLKTLWAELGVWDKNGHFRTLMKSIPVVMPSDIVSSNIDMKWMTVADNWESIYKLSGVDETRYKGGASMPDHIVRRVRDFINSSGNQRSERS